MRRTTCLLLLFLLLNFVRTQAQDTVLLFHPTAYNIQVFEGLEDDGIFSLEDIHVLGVFHEKESYDYQLAREYLAAFPNEKFSLRAIHGPLVPAELFGLNNCSQQFRHLFSISSGALFMGGPDIPPSTYGEPVHLLTRVTDPYRHYVEASYIFHLLGGNQNPEWDPFLADRTDYLLSGICLGMQTMNVATGGTMVQDIPTELYGIWSAEEILSLPEDQMHRNYSDMLNSTCEEPTSYHFHKITLLEDAFLSTKLEMNATTRPLVLSSHHQALEKLGRGLKVAARSMDEKIIEAIEHEVYPNVFGVQFHPEKPGLFDPDIIHPQNCSNTINFKERIDNSDSFAFHLAYWKHLSAILHE